jgi:hypothetical protein
MEPLVLIAPLSIALSIFHWYCDDKGWVDYSGLWRPYVWKSNQHDCRTALRASAEPFVPGPTRTEPNATDCFLEEADWRQVKAASHQHHGISITAEHADEGAQQGALSSAVPPGPQAGGVYNVGTTPGNIQPQGAAGPQALPPGPPAGGVYNSMATTPGNHQQHGVAGPQAFPPGPQAGGAYNSNATTPGNLQQQEAARPQFSPLSAFPPGPQARGVYISGHTTPGNIQPQGAAKIDPWQKGQDPWQKGDHAEHTDRAAEPNGEKPADSNGVKQLTHDDSTTDEYSDRAAGDRAEFAIRKLRSREDVPKEPKMPPSAYQFYVQDKRPTLTGSVGEVAKQLSTSWSSLSNEGKAPFVNKAKEMKHKYDKDLAAFRNTEPCK